jgi:hypothetical protein
MVTQSALSSPRPAEGQIVVVVARWILVVAGLLLALWDPGKIGELRLQVAVLLLLAVGNFALHLQLLRRHPVAEAVAYAASGADLAAITLLVIAQGGLASNLYVFYFTALLACSVAFPLTATLLFAGAAILTYGAAGLATAASDADLLALVTRLLMLAGVAACGAIYHWLEARRRTARLAPAVDADPAWSAGEAAS